MPPKQRPTKQTNTQNSSSQHLSQTKSLLTPPTSPKLPKPPNNDDRPHCKFGSNCKITNPLHFKRYRHDGVATSKQKSNLGNSMTNVAKAMKEEKSDKMSSIEAYKALLTCALSEGKINGDEKRLVRKYQKQLKITIDMHGVILAQLGWSEEDYFDGIRRVVDVDLAKEAEMVAQNENGVIWITNGSKEHGREGDAVYARVYTRFFQTMSCAQGNYNITRIGVIVNNGLKHRYNAKKSELDRNGNGNEEWAFHGTSKEACKGISTQGFLSPDKIDKDLVLDSGFFGNGIYLTYYSDYALFYSNERNSDVMLLCLVLPGKSYKCKKRMDGKKCVTGYDSHFSPQGNEIVVFDPSCILPKYIIEFKVSDATVRQQEG
ncbi:Uncharacterized protein QTN25_009771 [Entamoeba marina]